MADRRQSFSFRFWPARRAPTPPQPTPTSRPSTASQPVTRQSTTATTATPTPETQTQTPTPATTTNSPPTISPATQSPPVTTPTTPTKAQTLPPSPATTNSTPTVGPTAESQLVSRRPTTNTTPISPTSESQSLPPPTATTNSAPISTPTPEESQATTRQSTTTTTPLPPAETTGKPPQNPTSPRTPTLDPKTPPPIEQKTSSQPTTNSPIDEPKTSSPSTPTKSPSSSNPIASPSRRTPQSTSPPMHSSPSRPSPQARPITSSSPSRNSKNPTTSQRASQPRSPSRLTSKQIPSNSPSKESRQIDRTLSSNEEDSKSATTTQQEPQINELGNMNTTAEKLDPPTTNGERGTHVELKAKSEETKDVKEVTEATKIKEANEEIKKEVNGFLNPKSGSDGPTIEKSEIPNKFEEVHTEKQKEMLGREEILHTKKRSMNPHDKSAPTINKGIKDDLSTFVNQRAIGDQTNNERNVSIITLAGENRGASLQMGPTAKEGPVHIHRGYKKVNPEESGETTTDEEGNFKGKQPKDAKATEDQPTEAYVNNNAQGINNSIVFNASIAERDPGVHMVVTHVTREPILPAEKKMSPLETRRAEFNISRSEKLTYEEPTVRRRCLRGLFLETSDSDPENSEKPQRHGCRVGCKLKEKENSIDVL